MTMSDIGYHLDDLIERLCFNLEEAPDYAAEYRTSLSAEEGALLAIIDTLLYSDVDESLRNALEACRRSVKAAFSLFSLDRDAASSELALALSHLLELEVDCIREDRVLPEPSDEGDEDSGMSVFRGVAALGLGLWFSYAAVTTANTMSKIDSSRPQTLIVERVTSHLTFWRHEAWLDGTLEGSSDTLVVNLEPAQRHAYLRGDRVTVFALGNEGTALTDRQVLEARPVWRVGELEFSWQLAAALACLGYGGVVVAYGVLGARRELGGRGSLMGARERVLRKTFALVVGSTLVLAAVVGVRGETAAGARFAGVDENVTVPLEITGFGRNPGFPSAFFLTGRLRGDPTPHRLRASKQLFFETRIGTVIDVVRCADGETLEAPSTIANARPIFSVLGLKMTWRVVPAIICMAAGVILLAAGWPGRSQP